MIIPSDVISNYKLLQVYTNRDVLIVHGQKCLVLTSVTNSNRVKQIYSNQVITIHTV